ncbi:MAG: rsgA [Acidobacteria bacterium]|nr:rsgA [Acidobacteriota bacterium]
MDERQSKRQIADLKHHKQNREEVKRLEKAGKLRRTLKKKSTAREQGVTEENWEKVVEHEHVKGKKDRVPSSSDLAAELLDNAADDAIALAGLDPADAAIVISVASGRCRVFFNGEEIDCLIPPEIAIRQKSALAVGDRVVIKSEGDMNRLAAIFPRKTVLSRPDPLNKHLQRLVAANIDVVVHVVSIKSPPLRPRLIDRYFIAIQRGGAQPVICVNKIDLLSDAARERELAPLSVYTDLGVPVVPCSTHTGEGIEQLRQLVEGKTAALVGHSGVGKSSILNAVDEKLQLATNTLHRRGTGRHTTTSSSLYDFGGGTYLIDTPGIREFGLWDLDLDSLRDYFPEFADASEYCRFNDCTHLHEPGCEVKGRVESGEISAARYATYVRLAEDIAQPK